MPLMVYPKGLFPPSFSIKACIMQQPFFQPDEASKSALPPEVWFSARLQPFAFPTNLCISSRCSAACHEAGNEARAVGNDKAALKGCPEQKWCNAVKPG